MSKARSNGELRDGYLFPGFTPSRTVKGVFGDPMAVVIRLTRRRKKHNAGYAVGGNEVAMTRRPGIFAICRAAISASTSLSMYGGSDVRPVAK